MSLKSLFNKLFNKNVEETNKTPIKNFEREKAPYNRKTYIINEYTAERSRIEEREKRKKKQENGSPWYVPMNDPYIYHTPSSDNISSDNTSHSFGGFGEGSGGGAGASSSWGDSSSNDSSSSDSGSSDSGGGDSGGGGGD